MRVLSTMAGLCAGFAFIIVTIFMVTGLVLGVMNIVQPLRPHEWDEMFVIVLVLVIGAFIAFAAIAAGFIHTVGGRHRVRDTHARTPEAERSDVESIQQLHAGLERMAQRVEALETILIEQKSARGLDRSERKAERSELL